MATFNNRGIKAIVTDNSVFVYTTPYNPGNLMYTAPNDLTHLYTVLIVKNIFATYGGNAMFNIYNEFGYSEVTNEILRIGQSNCGSRAVMPNGTLGAQTYIQVSGPNPETYKIEGIGILLKSGDKIYVRHENFYPGQTGTITYYTFNYYGTE